MYYWKQDGVSIKVVLDKRQIRKSDLYPIRISVTYRRTIKDYGIDRKASEAYWERIMPGQGQNTRIYQRAI